MEKGVLRSLFDISFRSLITTKIIKVVYVLYMIVIALVALAFIVSAFNASAAAGVAVLVIGAPLGALVYLIFARVWLEALIALFRIMENTQELVRQGGLGSTPAATGPIIPPSASPPGPGGIDPLPPSA